MNPRTLVAISIMAPIAPLAQIVETSSESISISAILPETKRGRGIVYSVDFRAERRLIYPWSFRDQGGHRGYTNTPESIRFSVDTGLVIATDFQQSPPSSGMISTQNALYLRGGYIEASVVLPKLSGHHCAFWLKSDNYDVTGEPSTVGVELDVFEYKANTHTHAYSTVHGYGYGEKHKFRQKKLYLGESGKYSTPIKFAVDWQRLFYAFYVNDVEMARINEFTTWIPMYMILSCHPSKWGGYPPSAGPKVDSFTVQYLNIYQADAHDEYVEFR